MALKRILLFISLCAVGDAIKCKCTKESETVQCTDGVCLIQDGLCLMLDHPTIGVHYTCHTNKSLKDGSCRTKTSKSGAEVRICSCNSTDFCNYSYWPQPRKSSPRAQDEPTEDTSSETNGSALVVYALSSFISLIFFSL